MSRRSVLLPRIHSALCFVSCACALLSLGVTAHAQTPPDRPPVYLEYFEGPVISNHKVVGMGGAVSSVGQDPATFLTNPAGLSTRAPKKRDSKFGFGIVFSTWDRPGENRVQLGVSEANEYANDITYEQLQLNLQYRQYGFMFGVASQYFSLSVNDDVLVDGEQYNSASLSQTDTYMGWGVHFMRAQMFIGVSLHMMDISLDDFGTLFEDESLEGDEWFGGGGHIYSRGVAKIGFIWAPHNHPARAALVLRTPGIDMGKERGELPEETALLYDYRGIEVPWQVRFGGSVAFGTREYNTAYTYGDGPKAVDHRSGQRDLLVSTEVVVTGSAPGTTTLPLFMNKIQEAGDGNEWPTVNVHLGAESELIHNWLKLRAGLYEEMSRTVFTDMRPHITGGLEVRVPLYIVDLALAASFDYAGSYRNAGIGVGFWQ